MAEDEKKVESADEEIAGDGQSYKDLYTASQKGAIELKHRNEEIAKELEGVKEKLKEAEPILEAFEKDPNFLEHVKSYGKEQSTQKHSELGENLEFFDMSEAMKNPDSPSGKFLKEYNQSLLDKAVEEKLSKYDGERRFEARLDSEIREYASKHPELSIEEIQGYIEDAKKRPLRLEEMVDLVRRDKLGDDFGKEIKVEKPRNPYAHPSLAASASEKQPEDRMGKFKKVVESTAEDSVYGNLMR